MVHRVSGVSKNYTITQLGQDRFACGIMIQDGWERWEERSLDEAVQSVIHAGKALNGMELTSENILMQVNGAKVRLQKSEIMLSDSIDADDRRILDHLARAVSEFEATKQTHPNDIMDFRKVLYDAQRILAARIMRRIEPDKWLLIRP